MLSTKNIDLTPNEGGGNFSQKIIQPGNHKVRINNIELRKEKDPRFGEKLLLFLETPPIGNGFIGLAINKDDASQGNYEGRVGYVSVSRWGFKDSLEYQISRNDELFKTIGVLCRELSLVSWWDAQDNKYEHVDQLLGAFIKERPFDGVWFYCVISGRQYLSKDNKNINNELYFPREERVLGKAYSLNQEKVQKYNESLHLEKIKPKSDTNVPTSIQTPPEQSRITPEPSKPVSIKDTETNPAVLAFLNDVPTNKEVSTSPFTDEILNDTSFQNVDLTGATPIITADSQDRLPWED